MDARTEQLKRFNDNPMMVQAVYDTLYEFFHKKRETKDVYLLATERMSQNIFDEAWRMVESYKRDKKVKPVSAQIGL